MLARVCKEFPTSEDHVFRAREKLWLRRRKLLQEHSGILVSNANVTFFKKFTNGRIQTVGTVLTLRGLVGITHSGRCWENLAHWPASYGSLF